MGIRILHTADWQLGKPFGNFGPECGALLRTQRNKTIRWLAELATEREVDAVLVAGDVFEEQLASTPTLTGALGAMALFPGHWVLLPGNHDAAILGSIWERVRALAAGSPRVHLATTADPLLLADGRLAVLPAPLRHRHEAGDPTAYFDDCATAPGAIRVGLAHGSVPTGLPEKAESNNTIADDRAQRARLDYLALGDWHGTFRVSERAYYSGTPEPDRFKENDSGNVLVVEIAEPGAMPKIETVPIGHYRWTRLAPHLETGGDIEQLQRDLRALPEPERRILRLELAGKLDLAEDQQLGTCLDWWRGNMASLEVERSALRVRTTADDFAGLQPPGFVASAIETLRHSMETGDADAAAASVALQTLYRLCIEVSGGVRP